MPNEPLIEEYVEKLDKHETLHTGNCYCQEDVKCNSKERLKNFLRTSLQEYGDKRVGEVLSRVKELPTICGWCNKTGVNTFGECQCSYEESRYIKKSDVLSIITQKQ